MNLSQKLAQLKAYARLDGFIMSLFWLLSMWLSIKIPESIWGPILAISTPFFVSWRLNSFRDSALEGYISIRRSIVYSCYVFFYASLIFAIGQYFYFMYLDNGDLVKLLGISIENLEKNNINLGASAKELELSIKGIQLMSPIQLTFVFMMNNLVFGAFLSPIISLFSKLTEKNKR